MNRHSHTRSRSRLLGLTAGLAACLLLVSVQSVEAQRVPISFDDYHGYQGTVDYIQRVAREYSNITELLEIGESTMGRTMYVLVISRMNNGTTIDRYVPLTNKRKEGIDNVPPMKSYHGKPGMWIDGGTHGNELAGATAALLTLTGMATPLLCGLRGWGRVWCRGRRCRVRMR